MGNCGKRQSYLPPQMQTVGLYVDILALRRMDLEYPLLVMVEQVLQFAHLVPGWGMGVLEWTEGYMLVMESPDHAAFGSEDCDETGATEFTGRLDLE